MFANDKNIDNLQQLLAELKKYAELQKDYVKLHLVSGAMDRGSILGNNYGGMLVIRKQGIIKSGNK